MKRKFSELEEVPVEKPQREETERQLGFQGVETALELGSSQFLFTADENAAISGFLCADVLNLVAEYCPFYTRVVLSVLCPCIRDAVLFAESKKYNFTIASNWHFALSNTKCCKLVKEKSTAIDAEPFCVSLAHGLFRWRPLPPMTRDVADSIALKEVWHCQFESAVLHAAVTGDNVLAVGCYEDGLYFVDAANGEFLRGGRSLQGPERAVFVNGTTMAAAIESEMDSHYTDLCLYTVNSDAILTDSGKIRKFLDFNVYEIGSLKLSPTVDKLYVSCKTYDCRHVFWEFSTLDWTLLRTVPIGGTPRGEMDVSCDGKLLAVGFFHSVSETYNVDIIDTETMEVIRTLISHCGESCIWQLAFSPDSRFLAAATGRNAQVFEVETGQLLGSPRHYNSGGDSLFGVLWLSNDVFVAVDGSGTLTVWHIFSEVPVSVIEDAHRDRISFAVRLSNTSFVTGSRNGRLKKWQVTEK